MLHFCNILVSVGLGNPFLLRITHIWPYAADITKILCGFVENLKFFLCRQIFVLHRVYLRQNSLYFFYVVNENFLLKYAQIETQ